MRTENEIKLLEACKWGELDEIKALLKQGTNPQFHLDDGYPRDARQMDEFKTPLGEVMRSLYAEKHIEAVEALLDHGADINSYTHHTVIQTRSTPLGKALGSSNMTDSEIQQKVVDLLLSRGADVNLLVEEDMDTFMNEGNPALLESLLNNGLNPSAMVKGKTLLEYVISGFSSSRGNKKAEMAMLLIRRGADLSVKDQEGNSLIQRVSRPDVAALLLERDPNVLDCMTLHDNVILASPQFMQKLIDRGDDINAINNKGRTPLMEAACQGLADTAIVLINAGANLNTQNQNGETAMHIAMQSVQAFSTLERDYTTDKRLPILLELYSQAAYPTLDNKGRTPLMRCYTASKDYATIRFCIKEFSKFEARYYAFDEEEYAQKMREAYHTEMGNYAAFDRLPIHERPKHLFSGKLTQKPSEIVCAPSKEDVIEHAIKTLIINIKNNNVYSVEFVLKRFPEIDLNALTDKNGERPLSMAVQSVRASREDCLPMLKLLISYGATVNLPDNDFFKRTPLLACFHQHHIDKRSLLFLIENGANPNLGDYNNHTSLHLAASTFRNGNEVEEIIEILLMQGADPDLVSKDEKKPKDVIVLPWGKNKIPEVFAKFKPNKHNLIDDALLVALSEENRIIFASALRNEFSIVTNGGNPLLKAHIELSSLVEQLQSRSDLTPFSRNRLNFLNLLQHDSVVADKKEFSSDELEIVSGLIHQLSEADINVFGAVAMASDQFPDVQKIRLVAAKKIQFWYRTEKQKAFIERSADIETKALIQP